MKKTIMFTVLVAMLFGIPSCQPDVLDTDKQTITALGLNDGFLLKLNVPGSNINTRTAILTEPGEDFVSVLHLFFFQATGTQSFIDAIELRNDNGSPLDLSLPLQVPLHDTPTLNNNTDYKILIVANADAYVSSVETWLDSFKGVNFSTAIRKQFLLTGFNTTNRIATNYLLMSAEAGKSASQEEVAVTLTRAVVRIDVNFRNGLEHTHELVSASVWNVPQNTSIWDNAYNNYTDLIPNRAFQRIDKVADNIIKGQLYTFENRQNQVSQSDRHTTAVILGIRDRMTQVVSYHRVNVSLPFSGQDLKRNTVHTITVNHVLGEGATGATVEEAEDRAYNNNNSLLQVTVNNTDMDNQGVILIDGDNVLVIPTNRIVFSSEGGSREFTIFTYSPTGNAQLGASALVMEPGLSAVLSGNSLTVSATPSVDGKKGFIELVFGNITARIEVVQTSATVEFLELNVDINDIPVFSNMSNDAMDGNVQVTSSGAWTATIYNPFFNFVGTTPADTRMIEGNNGGTFRLVTAESNSDQHERLGFVIVSLVSNPNINRVLVLSQRGSSKINLYDPADIGMNISDPVVHFTASGTVASGHINTFMIETGKDNLAPTNPISITGANSAHFAYELNGNLLTITSSGHNLLEGTLSATLTIRSDAGIIRTIALTQAMHTLTLSADNITINSIAVTGGTTSNITVSSSYPAWTATITTSGTATDGRNLVNHVVMLQDQNGNSIVPGTEYGALTQLRVVFPKVYYPNREIPITATITVTNGILTRTITATQTKLQPRNFRIRGFNTEATWGGLSSIWGTTTFNMALRNALNAAADGVTSNNTWETVPTNHSMVYVSNYSMINQNWSVVNNWRNRSASGDDPGSATHKLTWMHSCNTLQSALDSYNSATSPLRDGGFAPIKAGEIPFLTTTPFGQLNSVSSLTDTRVYNFLVNRPDNASITSVPTTVRFTVAGQNTVMPTANLPKTAIPVMRQGTTTDAIVVICPVSQLIWVGEAEIFDAPDANASRFMNNLVTFANNAARYGSHFLDLFIDGSDIPAIWDAYWGNNTKVEY